MAPKFRERISNYWIKIGNRSFTNILIFAVIVAKSFVLGNIKKYFISKLISKQIVTNPESNRWLESNDAETQRELS